MGTGPGSRGRRYARTGHGRAVPGRSSGARSWPADLILDAGAVVALAWAERGNEVGQDAPIRRRSELGVVPADGDGDQVDVRIGLAGRGDPVELRDLTRVLVVDVCHVSEPRAAPRPEAPGPRASCAGQQSAPGRRGTSGGSGRGQGAGRRFRAGTAAPPLRTRTSRRARCSGAGSERSSRETTRRRARQRRRQRREPFATDVAYGQAFSRNPRSSKRFEGPVLAGLRQYLERSAACSLPFLSERDSWRAGSCV